MSKRLAIHSPGRATSERHAFEIELTAATLRAFRAFLVQVEKDAVLALRSPVVLAAAVPPEPFTLGKVLSAWTKVSTAIVTTIAKRFHLDPKAPYLTAVERRMLYSPLPTNAFTSVRSVLQVATSESWSKAKTVRSLATALNPMSGTVVNAVKGLETEGLNWDATARRIARTEATSAYGDSMNRALAANPASLTKEWVAFFDNATRPSHSDASGQVVLIDQTFDVGGESLMYPGDPNGSYGETANCRCVIVDGAGNDAETG